MGKAKKTTIDALFVRADDAGDKHIRRHARHLPRRRFHVDRDDGRAFLPDFRGGFIEVSDGDVEAFGEEFIAAATSAEGVGEFARDETVDDGFIEITYGDPSSYAADAPMQAKAR